MLLKIKYIHLFQYHQQTYNNIINNNNTIFHGWHIYIHIL
jgi:hypothetical protein